MKRTLLITFFSFFASLIIAQEKPELVLPAGHTKQVTLATYSPDGKFVLTGSPDLTIRSWESSSGRELNTFKGLKSIPSFLRFSPSGKTLLAGCQDGSILLWDFESRALINTVKIHSDSISCVDFFAEDRFLSASKDKTAKIYDLSTGKVTTTIRESRYKILSAAYYPQGDFIITGGGGVNMIHNRDVTDEPTKLWDRQGNEISSFVFGLFNVGSEILLTGFTNDGQYAFAVGDGQGRVYDLHNKNKLKVKFNGSASFAAVSPDKKVVLIGYHSLIQLIDLETGKVIRKLKNTFTNMMSAEFSPDGNSIVIGLANRAAVIVDALSGETIKVLSTRSGGVLAVTFSPYGKYLATGGQDGTAKIWDIETGALVKILKDQRYSITALSFSPDNNLIAVGNAGNAGVVYEISSGKALYAIGAGSGAIIFSPDGKKLAAINKNDFFSTLILFEAASGKLISNFSRSILKTGSNHVSTCIMFSPDGKLIYLGGKQDFRLADNDKVKKAFGEVQVWSAETGKYLKTFQDNHDELITSMDLTKDGKTMVTSSNDKSVWFWNTGLGLKTKGYDLHGSDVSSVSFSPDQSEILTAGYDRLANLFDINSKKSMVFTGHTAELFSAKFSPTGKYFVTGSLDNTTRLWSTESGKQIASLIPIDVSEWLIITPEGYFDGSDKALQTLYYSFKSITIPLEQIRSRYYKKGLLPILLGYAPGNLPTIPPFSSSDLYPTVKLNEVVNPKNPVLNIQLSNNGGGIGNVKVIINGIVAYPDARVLSKSASGAVSAINIPLSNSKLIKWGQRNSLQVIGYNSKNTLSAPIETSNFDAPSKIR